MRVRQPEDVGSIVHDRRRQLGWSQHELASRAGVGRQWLTELELGKKGAPLHLVMQTLEALGLALGVSDDAPVRLRNSRGHSLRPIEARTRLESDNAGHSSRPRSPSALATPLDGSKAPAKISDRSTAGSYRITDLKAIDMLIDRDRLYTPEYRPTLERMVGCLVAREAPIFGDLLARRIAGIHSLTRATAKLLEITREVTDPKFARSTEDGREIVWPDADVREIVPFRHASLDIRHHEDIPITELTSLALTVWSTGQTADKTAVLMGKQIGLARVSGSTRSRFKAAAELARGFVPDW
jgi:y4mF family transcriptional regulator